MSSISLSALHALSLEGRGWPESLVMIERLTLRVQTMAQLSAQGLTSNSRPKVLRRGHHQSTLWVIFFILAICRPLPQ